MWCLCAVDVCANYYYQAIRHLPFMQILSAHIFPHIFHGLVLCCLHLPLPLFHLLLAAPRVAGVMTALAAGTAARQGVAGTAAHHAAATTALAAGAATALGAGTTAQGGATTAHHAGEDLYLAASAFQCCCTCCWLRSACCI
jgi:hypothetical protein